MKHNLKVTLFLLAIFLAAQIIGLFIISQYVLVEEKNGVLTVTYQEVPLVGAPPEVNQNLSFIPIMIAVLVGTGVVFLLIKLGKPQLFRYWISIVVFLTLTIAFYAIIQKVFSFANAQLAQTTVLSISIILSIILTFLKFYRPNVIAHNLSELFVYGGIATIFVPLLNLLSVSILLILISAYDAYAVWKSKHMITLAKFQADAKSFSGLMIPYKREAFDKPKAAKKKSKEKVSSVKTAILGGGDIAFPLIFAGVIMKEFGMAKALIIPLIVTIALALLFFNGKEDRFYPAMPFLTAGCFIGLAIVWLI